MFHVVGAQYNLCYFYDLVHLCGFSCWCAGAVEQDVMANASVVCVFSGCQYGVNEVFPILGCWLVVRYWCLGVAYWSQNNGNELLSMVCNIPEERRPQRQCCFQLACLFGWYSQMWQCFFNHSLSQVTSLSNIHFSTFVGVAVQTVWKMCGQTCR